MMRIWTPLAALALASAGLACTKHDAEAESSQTAPALAPKEAAPSSQPNDAGGTAAEGASSRVGVEVTASGYTPATVEAEAGQPITLVFTRTTEKGCGEKLVFPDLDIERDLPLNEAVAIELTPDADQRIAFTCGMGMYKGSVVAVR